MLDLSQGMSNLVAVESRVAYERQLKTLYGAIQEPSPDIFEEILSIERLRANRCGLTHICRELSLSDLVFEYDTISQIMVLSSLEHDKNFEAAQVLKNLLAEVTQMCKSDWKLYNKLRKVISEAELDFDYAGGNHDVSSIRLSQILKSRWC